MSSLVEQFAVDQTVYACTKCGLVCCAEDCALTHFQEKHPRHICTRCSPEEQRCYCEQVTVEMIEPGVILFGCQNCETAFSTEEHAMIHVKEVHPPCVWCKGHDVPPSEKYKYKQDSCQHRS